MHSKRAFLCLAALTSLLAACGGGGGSSGGSGGGTATGYFKDSNVSGLGYRSGGLGGVTGEDGSFRYETGGTVRFFVGNVVLGETMGKSVITPIDLVRDGSLGSSEARRVVQFLMTLDRDGDPDNGIQISPQLREMAGNWQPVDFSAADFESRMAPILSDISSVEGRDVSLTDANRAYLHLRSTLHCIYSGAYKGGFGGGASGVFGMMVSADGGVSGIAFSDGEYAELNGSVNLGGTRMIFGMEDSATGTAFAGLFSTPDGITGKWQSTAYSVSGSFTGSRVGGALDAAYRFTGSYSGDDHGLFAFDIEDTGRITGIAYSLGADEEYPLTGQLSGTTLSVTASNGTKATGSIDMARGTLGGSWSGKGEEGVFVGSGCRLN